MGTKRALFSAVAAVAFTAPVMAADLPAKVYTKAPPVVAPVMSWSGCYVGANVGGDWSRARFDNVNFNSTGFGQGLGAFSPGSAAQFGPEMTNDLKSSGFIGGGQVGCNFQSGGFVIGWESDLQYTDLSSTLVISSIRPSSPSTETLTESFKSKWLNTDRVRVGFANGPWLFYATGGLAVANITYNDGFIFTTGGGTTAGVPIVSNVSTTRVGWTAGVGAEWMISGNWSVKGEYLYVDLGKTSTVASAANGGNNAFPLAFFTLDHHLTENIVRVGVNYHFSGPVVAKY